MEDLVERLNHQLRSPLPGVEAQYEMAPVNRQKVFDNTSELMNYKQSAVLILLYKNHDNNWQLPLIKRVNTGGVHSGQVSLPGGSFDKNDVTLKQTAIRETIEEIGASEFNVIGSLTELYIPVSQFKVQPFIAVSEVQNPDFKISTSEVDHLIELPLVQLLEKATRKEGLIKSSNSSQQKAPYFEVKGYQVWGATAMILNELRAVLNATY